MKGTHISLIKCLVIIMILLMIPFGGCKKTKKPVEIKVDEQIGESTKLPKQKPGPLVLSDLSNTSNPKQRKWMDIPYATLSQSQKLDIYLPEKGNGPFPVIISIHGGGLSEGDKQGLDLKAAIHGLTRDYAVISINYRLLGEASMPAQINDVKAAIRFIRAHAYTYHLNPMKIALWGGSAGGYLASLAGTASDIKDFNDSTLGNYRQSDKVQAVVDWYGPITNLSVMGLKSNYFTTPSTYVSKDDAAFLIQHGRDDKLVSLEQSIVFAQLLTKTLGNKRVELTIFEKAGHADPIFFTSNNIEHVLNFLDRHLK